MIIFSVCFCLLNIFAANTEVEAIQQWCAVAILTSSKLQMIADIAFLYYLYMVIGLDEQTQYKIEQKSLRSIQRKVQRKW